MKISTLKVLPALLLGALVAPALSGAQNAEAKPKNSAPAYGYRSKEDRKDTREYRKERREDKREYRKDRREDRREYRNDQRDNDDDRGRRYRTRYRTRYNSEGQPYRQYFRVYY